MDRNEKILTCFDTTDELTITNEFYQDFTKRLFSFLIESDLGVGDASQFPAKAYQQRVECAIIVKENGVAAGLEEIQFLLKKHGIESVTETKDGDNIKLGDVLMKIRGEAGRILALERTILNILQRLCGIATMTANYRSRIKRDNCYVIGTRKTLFGYWDKKAVQCGGGLSHRLNLEDAAMLKENHLDILDKTGCDDCLDKGLEEVVKNNEKLRFVEVEVTDEKQFWKVAYSLVRLQYDVNKVIMFDHFTIHQIKKIINEMQIKGIYDDILLEASGNIDLESIGAFAESGVDVVSSGALTHSVTGLDLSLLFDYN
ncbi:MAG: carboxylating nicotinate-nucleotide diphosphorylase [Fidelibacterota bacterium]